MRPAEMIYKDILSRPESDDLRREYADAIRSERPAWSEHIEECLQSTALFPYQRFAPSDELCDELEAPFRKLGIQYVEFYRGFIETLHVQLDTFLQHGDELLDLAPILSVVLYHTAASNSRGYWKDRVPELLHSSAIGRVRELRFRGDLVFDFQAMRLLFETPRLQNLLALSDDNNWAGVPWLQDDEDDEQQFWDVALESPIFRRMIDWGLRREAREFNHSFATTRSRLLTRRQLGDRKAEQSYGTSGLMTTYEPMDAESRALEEKYGYIPALHAGNWSATILDVLQGKKPDFPAGAAPTESMYAVPPPHNHVDTGW